MKILEERCSSTCDFFFIDNESENSNCRKDCSNNIKKHIELKNKSNFIVLVLSVFVSFLLLYYLYGIYRK